MAKMYDRGELSLAMMACGDVGEKSPSVFLRKMLWFRVVSWAVAESDK